VKSVKGLLLITNAPGVGGEAAAPAVRGRGEPEPPWQS